MARGAQVKDSQGVAGVTRKRQAKATDGARLTAESVRVHDGEAQVTGRGRGAGSLWDNVVSEPVMPVMKCHRFWWRETWRRGRLVLTGRSSSAFIRRKLACHCNAAAQENILMEIRLCGGALIYFHMWNTAAAALNRQRFLMFNVYMQFERFHQLKISEERDVNVVNGYKHGHVGEPRQVQ